MMTSSLSSAVREITRLEQEVKRAPDHVECLIRLGALARLLLGSGPVGPATAAIVAASALDEITIEQQAVRRSVAPLKDRTRAVIDDIQRCTSFIHDTSGLRQTVSSWRGNESDVGQVLANLRDSDELWGELALLDLRVLAKAVFPAFCTWLHAVEQAVPAGEPTRANLRELQELRLRASMLGGEFNLAFDKAQTGVMYARAFDHRNTRAALERLVSASSSFHGPEVDVDALAAAAEGMDELLPRCERLVSAVRARLLEGPERSHALDRLTLQLEHIEKESLLERMEKAERPEDVLQETVKRFLFAQGLWPVTQLMVGPGRADVFVEVPDEAAGMQCILLELKQAVRDSSLRAVQKAVTVAIDQVELYSIGLRSSARWRLHEVYIVVAYAGPRRFSVPRDSQVRLIYLGAAAPSAGVTPLFAPKSKSKPPRE